MLLCRLRCHYSATLLYLLTAGSADVVFCILKSESLFRMKNDDFEYYNMIMKKNIFFCQEE